MQRANLVTLPMVLAALAGLATSACHRGGGAKDDDGAATAFGEDASESASNGNTASAGDEDPGTSESDSDTSGPTPDVPPEPSCEASNQAFIKRLIPFVQGRKPDSIREVRLLAQMIEQLDERGENGREIVARGLMRGEFYRQRWETHLFEELRINRVGDRRNDLCYDQRTDAGNSSDLAAFIRDNGAQSDFGASFFMADVIESAIRLDDLSPAYRAEVFGRMSAPIVAGNVNMYELETARRANFGQGFEQAWLGRKTECNACHRSEFSVTDSVDPDTDRHWPVPGGNFELSVYGPQAGLADDARSHAVFRFQNFAFGVGDYENGDVPSNATTAFGMAPVCGSFRFPTGGQDLFPDVDGFMVSDYEGEIPNNSGPSVFLLDNELREGFEVLRDQGLAAEGNENLPGSVAAAYLISMNIANRTWREAMGYPLTVANNFPRNISQRDELHQLTDTFVNNGYSLRSLLTEIVTSSYFNQPTPDQCDDELAQETPYYMPALFDPFTKSAEDPDARGNGIGDSLHRLGAWIILDSVAQAMWWDRPERFGPDEGETPASTCGQNMVNNPCDEAPAGIEALRDLGAFLSDSEGGFEGSDLRGLLRLEWEYGPGEDPNHGSQCTGPLGQDCAEADFISALVAEAAGEAGADMWDLASALKDRLLTDPSITDEEAELLEDVMGVSLSSTVDDVGNDAAEAALRSLVAVFVNSPQFVLVGAPAPDVDEADDPTLVVPGTSTRELCEYLAPLVLDNGGDGYTFDFSCSDEGVAISG